MLTVISGNNRNGYPCALNKVGDIFKPGIPPFATEGLTDFKSGNSQEASQKGGFPLAGPLSLIFSSVKVTASGESKTYAGVTVSMTSEDSAGYGNLSSPESGSAKYRQHRSPMRGLCADNLLNRKADSAFVQATDIAQTLCVTISNSQNQQGLGSLRPRHVQKNVLRCLDGAPGKEKGPAVSPAFLSTSMISCTGESNELHHNSHLQATGNLSYSRHQHLKKTGAGPASLNTEADIYRFKQRFFCVRDPRCAFKW